MSKVKDWLLNEKEEEERNELFEEMYMSSKEGQFETIEQLQSDNEDLRNEIEYYKTQIKELKGILKRVEDRYSSRWVKSTE